GQTSQSLVFSPAPTNSIDNAATSAINGQSYTVDGTVSIQAAINRVYVPTTGLSGAAGTSVNVPVNLQVDGSFTGVDGIGLVLSYDNRIFDGSNLTTSTVTRGALLSNNWTVGGVQVFNGDPNNPEAGYPQFEGRLIIQLFTSQNEDFTGGTNGTLVN